MKKKRSKKDIRKERHALSFFMAIMVCLLIILGSSRKS